MYCRTLKEAHSGILGPLKSPKDHLTRDDRDLNFGLGAVGSSMKRSWIFSGIYTYISLVGEGTRLYGGEESLYGPLDLIDGGEGLGRVQRTLLTHSSFYLPWVRSVYFLITTPRHTQTFDSERESFEEAQLPIEENSTETYEPGGPLPEAR